MSQPSARVVLALACTLAAACADPVAPGGPTTHTTIAPLDLPAADSRGARPGACGGDHDCEDGNLCTVDRCVKRPGRPMAVCAHEPRAAGTACDDHDLCTTGDACDGQGSCVPSGVVTCDPAAACRTAGTCDPRTGACSYAIACDGAACSDGDDCTGGDTCQAGTCEGEPLDLLASWDFEGDLADGSGAGHDGVPNASAVFVPGRSGQALAFDGGFSFTITDGTHLGPTTGRERSYAFWLNAGTDGGGWVITQYWNYDAGNSAFAVGAGAEGAGVIGNGYDAFYPSAPGLQGWHHWTMVFGLGGVVSVYLDGDLLASGTVQMNGHESTAPAMVGAFTGIEGGHLKGHLDELKVFARALSASEVATLRAQGSTCGGTAP